MDFDNTFDAHLMELLETDFGHGFKHRHMMEFCYLLDQIVRRGLPISIKQHTTVDLTLKTKIAGAQCKFSERSNGYLRELFRIGRSIFPSDFKNQLMAEAKGRLDESRFQLNRLIETRDAWNAYEQNRLAIGTLRRRR
ncbi:hypothetical protein [Fuerstiella marisgermanici]|uniref:Uncharacterized protein n=1 Tax=Fuerstiella marisgermanici TaxID=1891926 RepID=A0A1P8WR86_9PLAN|nr:hypothetical protein [Fuerstiella marisgermanici]APZ96577.1 hypothetical protein Fuma_06247 [Fuerstiella marisgermanici]